MNTFEGCESLTSIVLPNELNKIEKKHFIIVHH